MRLLMLGMAAVLTACGVDLGSGSVTGSLLIPQCDGDTPKAYTCADDGPACDAFHLDVDFPSLETFERRAVIRLQHGGRALALSDGLAIEIPDVDQLPLGVPVPVLRRRAAGSPAAAEEGVRVALAVFERCPNTRQSFALEGHVVFSAFGTDSGDRVAGAFDGDGLAVFDGRDGARLGTLRGTFDFKVARGGTHQRFTDDI